MNIAILGYGGQGRSAYEYWRGAGNVITVCDRSEALELPEDVKSQLGGGYLRGLERFDLLVRSPGVHPRDIVAANTPEILQKVTTNTNEFLRVCPTSNVIGVTGTKGKGTTSTLITKMLEADGQTVHLGGNIGIPPLDLLKQGIQADDWVVLELANFQLIDLQRSPHIAVCLMVTPEHLDWHVDTDEYYEAKSQLFRHQKPDDIAIYYAENENSKRIASTGTAQQIPYSAAPGAVVADERITIGGQTICQAAELKLLGRHNWQNVCAAVTAVWQVTQNTEAIRRTLTTFSGLPFRIEFRREVNGIRYYDDSFASAPPATVAALEAIPGKKVVIIGGHDRGLDLSGLADGLVRLQDEIRRVVLAGASAERAAAELTKGGFSNFDVSAAHDMTGIVADASQAAQDGDAVILSPGFPSFDMFKNFEDRGRQFNEVVEKL